MHTETINTSHGKPLSSPINGHSQVIISFILHFSQKRTFEDECHRFIWRDTILVIQPAASKQ